MKAKNNKFQQAIISLTAKYQRVSQSNETYYLFTYQLHRNLIKQYFALTGEKTKSLTSNSKPLFVFNEKKKWAKSLPEHQVYFVEYTTKNHYLHLHDWRILGDKATTQRSWNLLLKKTNHAKN